MARKSSKRSPHPKSNGHIGVDFNHDPKPRYIAQPRVFCTLNPETGELQIELGGPAGRQQPIVVKSIEAIRNILEWQWELANAQLPVRIGETFADNSLGAHPTEAQIRHWEEHSRRTKRAKLQSKCPFCITEAKAGVNVSVRKFDTRGNPIRIVTDPADLGF